MAFAEHFAVRGSTAADPAKQPIVGREQDMMQNEAGGYVFSVDDWTMLRRFLILGTEGGTFYTSEASLTIKNARAVVRCLKADGKRVVCEIVEVSRQGRAPKNDFALFALAMAASFGVRGVSRGDMGDGREGLSYCQNQGYAAAVRKAALNALPKVARTGTHVFQFASYIQQFRGWGRGLRRAVGDAWYAAKDGDKLAYQMLKYGSRDGWKHRDLLRLAHPNVADFDMATRKSVAWAMQRDAGNGLVRLDGLDHRMQATAELHDMAANFADMSEVDQRLLVREAAEIVRGHSLPREVVPGDLLRYAETWDALLEAMPMGAMLRTLNRMTQAGLLTIDSEATRYVCDQLRNVDALKKARIHPVDILIAMRTYASGNGMRGNLQWTPVSAITNAMDDGFYLSFETVEPTDKRHMLCLDVSGSMSMNKVLGGVLTCREAATAMAMSTAAVEEHAPAYGFTAEGSITDTGLTPLDLSPRRRLDDIVRETSRLPMGATDTTLPIKQAIRDRTPVDCFVIYTDNENWRSDIHPAQALQRYRDVMGIDARMIAVAMKAERYSVADPKDAGMLDVIGFDASLPRLVADFARGEV